MPDRFLIVNADDFGYTDGINLGIIEAHRKGIVTSASLMVKQPRAAEAAVMAVANPQLGLGLHIDLAEWEPVDGVWQERYSRVDLEDQAAVAAEIKQQLELFIELVGRNPDHLDSHQHVHLKGAAHDEAVRLAISLGVPLRSIDPDISFCGAFYGQQGDSEPYPEGVSLANLYRLVDEMPEGWTELMCHPGHANGLNSVYSSERESELAVLCQPELPDGLKARQVQLRSFADFSSRQSTPVR